ncbi:MAG: hypothetical protein OQK82_08680 [Candidatus Pacearchaeota archaeon]|nr:hypothetical protein [Candidatus Pacearchaeota archaeon]
MNQEDLIKKIMSKKEFSKLPKEDVQRVLESFDKKDLLDEEKVKLSRDLLRKMYTAFVSSKLLNVKDKESEWFLKKHISTRERFGSYEELYERLLKNFNKKFVVFDLGAGVNGFSYEYFKDREVSYVAIEAVGQLVELMNNYFKKNNNDAVAIHESLFNLESVKKILESKTGKKIVFLFKTIDSLEMLDRNYSKELLMEIVPLVDEVVVSFATHSLISKKKFNVRRNWIIRFIEENFIILDDFKLGNERYIVIKTKDL